MSLSSANEIKNVSIFEPTASDRYALEASSSDPVSTFSKQQD